LIMKPSKSLKGLIARLLLPVMLITSLAGCTAGGDGNVTTDTEPAEAKGILLVSGSDEDLLTIVRPQNASGLLLNCVSILSGGYRESVPGFNVTDDWTNKPGTPEYEAVTSRYEILVGLTNRPESAAAAEGLGLKDWAIVKSDKKLSIAGGSDWALRAACSAFAAGITVDENGDVRYTGELTGKSDYSQMIIATDQKTSSVEIYDITSASKVGDCVWSKVYSEYNIADARARLMGDKLVVTAAFGTSSASIVDYDTKKILWSTSNAPRNPHACELVPVGSGYVAVVAGTTGNAVRFFDTSISGGPSYTEIVLEDAHGALYDPELGVVWCQGLDVLTAYEIRSGGATPEVIEREDLRVKIPTTNSHELQSFYGDKDKLWVTTSTKVYIFSKSTKTFTTDLAPMNQSIERGSVKGIGNFADGSVVLITPDGGFKSWTSETITFFTMGKYETTVRIAGSAFYKVRAFDPSYN